MRQDELGRDFPGKEHGIQGYRANRHCQAEDNVLGNDIKGKE